MHDAVGTWLDAKMSYATWMPKKSQEIEYRNTHAYVSFKCKDDAECAYGILGQARRYINGASLFFSPPELRRAPLNQDALRFNASEPTSLEVDDVEVDDAPPAYADVVSLPMATVRLPLSSTTQLPYAGASPVFWAAYMEKHAIYFERLRAVGIVAHLKQDSAQIKMYAPTQLALEAFSPIIMHLFTFDVAHLTIYAPPTQTDLRMVDSNKVHPLHVTVRPGEGARIVDIYAIGQEYADFWHAIIASYLNVL
jgi:hypothetical protein